MRNRRLEMRSASTKCWTLIAITASIFLIIQMHFTNVREESPPPLNLNHPNDFFEIQDAKRKSSHYHLERKNWQVVAEKYVHSLSEVRMGDLQHPQHISSPERTFIKDCLQRGKNFGLCNKIPRLDPSDDKFFLNIGMSVVNIDKTRGDLDSVFKQKFLRNLESLLEFSSVRYLHFIFVTDSHTLLALRKVISHFLSRQVALNVIQDRGWRWRRMREFPVVKVSYVDIKHIVGLNRDFTASMKNVSKLSADEKYSDDLFYIAPMYHGAFIKLDKLIYLDCADIVFLNDIKLLAEQFSMMGPALMGVGLDKSPHYRAFLGEYIYHNPGTPLGLPGPKQGFNTGVVLFNLNNMRNSELYNRMISPEKVKAIQGKYKYKFTLGDQDWFTNLGNIPLRIRG